MAREAKNIRAVRVGFMDDFGGLGGLGNVYMYDLLDKPFLQGEKVVMTRYMIPVKRDDGSRKFIIGSTQNEVVQAYKRDYESGWREYPMTREEAAAQIKVQNGLFTTYYIGGKSRYEDLGPAYVPPSNTNPFGGGLINEPKFISDIKAWWNSLFNPMK